MLPQRVIKSIFSFCHVSRIGNLGEGCFTRIQFRRRVKCLFFTEIKFCRSNVLLKYANNEFVKNFAFMFGADFDYITITKKTNSHRNVLFLAFSYNTNNSLCIADHIDNESGYFKNKRKIRN